MTTLPGVGGVGAFIIASAKPVVLEVIHKLKQVNCHGGLTEVGNEVGQASVGKATKKQSLDRQRSAGVNGSSTVGSPDLPRNRLQHVVVDATAPR